MQPYNARAVCPKCGSDDVLTYHTKAKPVYGLHAEVVRMESEHMQRRCRRCLYKWEELPLDAASSTTEGE